MLILYRTEPCKPAQHGELLQYGVFDEFLVIQENHHVHLQNVFYTETCNEGLKRIIVFSTFRCVHRVVQLSVNHKL